MEHKTKAILIILSSVLLISTAQLLLKYGIKNATSGLGEASLGIMLGAIFTSWQVLAAVCLLLVSSTLWLIGLSKADLSFAAPMLGAGYALVAFFSWLLFNEALGAARIMGIFVIITGVIMMSRS